MHLCFYSDELSSNFLPLTLTRPLDDLRIGIHTIRQKWETALHAKMVARTMDYYLEGVFTRGTISGIEPTLWLNNRFLPSSELILQIKKLQVGESIWHGNHQVAYFAESEISRSTFSNNTFPVSKGTRFQCAHETSYITQFWDLLQINGEQIQADLNQFNYQTLFSTSFKQSCSSVNPTEIFVANNAHIEPGCVFIADSGPIFIGENVTIGAGTILRGPVAICKSAIVKMGSKISAGTTVGPHCKVGGEIKNSIFHSYSNKSHDGFMGNSIIGQWCNFGAGTITSNLKNNFGLVKLSHWETGISSNTGVQFFGAVVADHSKTAIGTKLNTGTVCGVSSNILSSGFPPKIIRSFNWLSDNGLMEYRFNHALETMKAMMARRDVTLTNHYKEMMAFISKSEQTSSG